MEGNDSYSFRGDLLRATAVLRRYPWLPVVSVALALVTHLPDAFFALVLVFLALNAGWLGTERIVYLRAFRADTIGVGELWRLTRAFVMRFAVLGLVVTLPFVPFVVLAFSHVLSAGPRRGFMVTLIALSVMLDVALTFVTPALAFTTRSVRKALTLGIGMIRSEWPKCAWYALVPPLAALFVAQSLTRDADVGIGIELAASAVGTLLNLWFKGAIAAFYLRRHVANRDGAAFVPKREAGAAPASPPGLPA